MTVAPGYPNPDEVANARQGAMRAIALGQAVAVDHARTLLAALAFCEQTIDEYAALICELTGQVVSQAIDVAASGVVPAPARRGDMGGLAAPCPQPRPSTRPPHPVQHEAPTPSRCTAGAGVPERGERT